MSDEIPISLEEERKKRRAELSLLTTERVQKCYPCCAWVVHGKTRTITCKKCERVIEPFDAMMELASDFEGYQRNRDHLRTEIEMLRANAAELKKHVESLKGMERRLLKDTKLIETRMADRLEIIADTRVKKEWRLMVRTVAHFIRRGEWRELGT